MSLPHALTQEEVEERIAASVRAVAGHAEAQVRFVPALSDYVSSLHCTDEVALPAMSALAGGMSSFYRGLGDSAALPLRFHQFDVHAVYRPEDALEQSLFDACEWVRLEYCALQWVPGVAANIRDYVYGIYQQLAMDNLLPQMQLVEMVKAVLRSFFLGYDIEGEIASLVEAQGVLITGQHDCLSAMQAAMENQADYAQATLTLIDVLRQLSTQTPPPEHTESSQESLEEEQEEQSAEGEQSQSMSVDVSFLLSAMMQAESQEHMTTQQEQQSLGEGEDGSDTAMSPMPFMHGDNVCDYSACAYTVYTQDYDQIVMADALCDTEELLRLRQQLDQKLHQIQDVSKRLAQQLRAKLLAKQQRRWDFNLDDGYLDAARLAAVVADPNFTTCYKWQQDDDALDTVVTLLLDNSGSMRGRPITIAALCADILARTLEQCGVKVEILGFTTCDWKGGHSRIAWQQAGAAPHPGRLNDVRHIIYKSADQPWRRAHKNLGLMLKEGLLKENIDGEAILWAYDRLLCRAEKRKILMVISDGAPVDDSTLSVNVGSYLDDHLHRVIHMIESRSHVELCAIGIGHDVTRYYHNAITIRDADQLGEAMYQQMMGLFG